MFQYGSSVAISLCSFVSYMYTHALSEVDIVCYNYKSFLFSASEKLCFVIVALSQ